MIKPHDETWSAYIDGELDANESARFEADLEANDREWIASEKRMDSAIADAIGDAPRCPDALWASIRDQVSDAATADNVVPIDARRSRVLDWGIPALAAAAAMLLAVAMFLPAGQQSVPGLLELAAADVPALEASSDVRGRGAEIEDYLRQSGLGIELTDDPTVVTEHPVRLLGASTGTFNGERYQRIKYDCCKKPVEIIATRVDGAVAQRIREAIDKGEFEGEIRQIGGMLITVVGDAYHGHEVIGLIGLKVER